MGPQRKHKHLLKHYTRTSRQTTTTAGQQLHNIQGQHTHQPQIHCKCLQQTVHQHYSSQDNTTNRKTNRKVLSLQPTQINITFEQVLAAIKNSKNNNSTGPDNINIKHLKNFGKNGLQYLTNIYNAAINDNKIPHVWKLANIIPISKPNKDINIGTSYRPISLQSVIAKTLQKVILPYITQNILNITTRVQTQTLHKHSTPQHQQGCRNRFNQPIPPTRTIAVALDRSEAFDTVNIHTLIDKLTQTNIPHSILRYIANYIKGHMAYTTFRNHTSTIQIRSSTRRRPFTHTLQHLHFRHPTTTRLCTTDYIRGRHNCANVYPPYPGSPEARAPIYLGSQSCNPATWLAERQVLAGHIESNPGLKPTLKALLHSLNPPLTISPIQPSQSSPPSLSPNHTPPKSPTSVKSYLPPLQNTPTYHRASSTAHTYIPQATYWTSGCLPVRVVPMLARWKGRMAGLH